MLTGSLPVTGDTALAVVRHHSTTPPPAPSSLNRTGSGARAAGPVTLQVGWRRLRELGAQVHGDVRRVPVGPTARAESTIRSDNVSNGSVNLWSLAGAVGLTNRLSAGWSLDVYRSGWEERWNLSELPGILGPGDFLSLTQTNELSGHALNLGLLLAYPAVSVGLVYHGALQAEGLSEESLWLVGRALSRS